MIGDVTLSAVRAGLSGLTARRAASEDAIANLETPGYTARRVDFEDSLARAIGRGEPSSFRAEVSATTDRALPNGNNVQVEQEIVSLTETALRQQLLVEAANAKYRLLRTVMGV